MSGGQERRAGLDEGIGNALQYYLGPTGIPERLNALGMFNPVQDIGQAMGDARDGDYTGAAVNTLTALAPAIGGSVAMRSGANTADDAARWLEETLAGIGIQAQGAAEWGGEFARADDGMFLGPSALNAPLGRLEAAKELDDFGATRDEIWRETGWFKGVDDKWRFEIDDRGIDLRSDADARAIGEGMRAEAAEIAQGIKQRNANLKMQPDLFPGDLKKAHGDLRRKADQLKQEAGGNFGPEWSHAGIGQRAQYAVTGNLGQAYPDLMRQTIVRSNEGLPGYKGSYDPKGDKLNLSRQLTPSEKKSTLLHELQHGVQAQEGFGFGANVDGIATEIKAKADAEIGNLNKRLSEIFKAKQAAETAGDINGVRSADVEYRKIMREKEDLLDLAAGDPVDIYRRVSGEVEARNVQARRNFTPEQRRATPPWETQDIPDEQQIVRFGDGTSLIEIVRKYGIAGAATILGVSASDVQAAINQQQPKEQ